MRFGTLMNSPIPILDTYQSAFNLNSERKVKTVTWLVETIIFIDNSKSLGHTFDHLVNSYISHYMVLREHQGRRFCISLGTHPCAYTLDILNEI